MGRSTDRIKTPGSLLVYSNRRTYCSKILFVKSWSLNRNLDVIAYFRFSREPIERGRKGCLHMVVGISCQIQPQGIKAGKQRAVVGAVIVERDLVLG